MLPLTPTPQVGHIFRSFHPYTFPGNKDTHGINTARTVEVGHLSPFTCHLSPVPSQVWMNEYKRLFYMHRPDLLNTDIGSVTNRLKFKEVCCGYVFAMYSIMANFRTFNVSRFPGSFSTFILRNSFLMTQSKCR